MNPATQHGKISTALQVVSIFAVAATFFGFLIVNIHLAIFGFWDFNFLRAQYFSAGGLFIFFVSLPAVLFYAFFRATNILEKYQAQDKTPLKSVLVFVTKLIIFAALAYLSFCTFLFPVSLSNASFPPSVVIVLGIFWTAIVFGSVSILIKSHADIIEVGKKEINLKNILVYFVAHYRLLYIAIALPLLTLIFAFFVYSTVPRYFGGGKLAGVSIGLDQNFNNERIGVANPFDAFLVYQSQDSLLVLTTGGAYLLRQSDIAYIKYLETSARIRALQNLAGPNSTAATALPNS